LLVGQGDPDVVPQTPAPIRPALSYLLSAFGRSERGKATGLAQGRIGDGIVLSILLMLPLFPGLGWTAVWSIAVVLGIVRVGAVLLLREGRS
jgi:hypothetical protein